MYNTYKKWYKLGKLFVFVFINSPMTHDTIQGFDDTFDCFIQDKFPFISLKSEGAQRLMMINIGSCHYLATT